MDWDGGKTRRVELIWAEGLCCKAGDGLVPFLLVFVRDVEGTRREEYFYRTDPTIAPQVILAAYVGRWSVEATFQKGGAHLDWATTQNWRRTSVLRTTPCLLGLFSIVCLAFDRHARGRVVRRASSPRHAKAEPTFDDALTRVRRLCWAEVFQQSPKHSGVMKLPKALRTVLLDQLSRAA